MLALSMRNYLCRFIVLIVGEFVQFFYADLDHPQRITHVVDGVAGDGGASRWRVSELFHDTRGKLFAMRRESELFYIALDPTDSPIVVLNGVGSVVKQVSTPKHSPSSVAATSYPFNNNNNNNNTSISITP